jgi:hypothetical protein
VVLSKKVIEIDSGRKPVRHPAAHPLGDLPDVPVLPETLLMMEFCAQRQATNLHELAEIVLGDLGAAIQIMHKAGQECMLRNARPDRVEDYISALGVQGCMGAASRRIVTRGMNKSLIRETWSHSNEIARRCKLLADENICGEVNPTEAYLTGLFHKIGSLPVMFDWDLSRGLSGDPVHGGLRLADAWFLPQCIAEYFSELQDGKSSGRLTRIVRQAHEAVNLTPKG